MKSIKNQYRSNASTDNKGKIKYLFWINIDALIKDIKTSDEYIAYRKTEQYDSTLTEKFFNILFNKTFKYCNDYTKFLNITLSSNAMFFDHQQILPLGCTPTEKDNWNYNDNIFTLFKEALKNHLIIHSFLSSVNRRGNSTLYSLVAKEQDTILKTLDNNKVSFKIHYKQETHNFYHRRKMRYHADTKKLLYSHNILDDVCDENINSFKVSRAFKVWAYYCYAAKAVLNFDNYLLKYKKKERISLTTFFKCYQKLYYHTLFLSKDDSKDPAENSSTSSSIHDKKRQQNSSFQKEDKIEYENDFSSPSNASGSEKILFRYPAEWYYGFSSSNYIYRILSECHDLTIRTDSSSTLRSLNGNDFSESLKKIYSLPNVFSRHFFLKYACIASLQSKTHKFEYLEPSHRSMSIIDKESASLTASGSLAPRINNFITMLCELTIPILETCWDIVISELNIESEPYKPENKKTILDMNDNLKNYVDDHYNELTFDYTSIPDEILIKKNTSLTNKDFIKKLFNESNKKNPVKTSDYSKIFNPNFTVTSDKQYACHDLFEILIKHFDSSSPIISPENDLLNIQISPDSAPFTPKNDILKNFLNRNLHNVFTYYIQEFDTRTK